VAGAHETTFAVYSKYEATTNGNRIAFVFALDKTTTLALLSRDAGRGRDEPPENLAPYRAFFTSYLFSRFSVANAGVPCTHPDELGQFFFDEKTVHVLAVTTFTCSAPLSNLTIRSLVTHDMPAAHELVGDLQHGAVIVRRFFVGDDVEAHIDVGSLPASGVVQPWRPRPRNRFSYVPEPDTTRRFNALTSAELGVDVTSPASTGGNGTTQRTTAATILSFIGQGIVHIFTGYDHVLFIVTLMLVVSSWKHLAIIVTSFTAAHSLTLVVATLGIVTLPSRFVEPLIALTVLVVAVDAILRPEARARALVAFGFGLVHGLGLSNALRELGLSGRALAPALFGFNVGVEIGQLLIVAPLFWLVLLLRKRPATFLRVRNLLCASVALIAVFWIVVRVRQAFLG
jgi:hydrogenase/urease accessory protein HupE